MLVLQRTPTYERPATLGSQIICTLPDDREIVITLLPQNRIGVKAPLDVVIVRDDARPREAA